MSSRSCTLCRTYLHGPAETFDDALQHLVDQATLSLSCDVGIAYIPEQGMTSICDRQEAIRLSLCQADVAEALAVIAERQKLSAVYPAS